MTSQNVNPFTPRSISPQLICSDAIAAIDFYKKAFDAEEIIRLVTPKGGLMHANLKIGDSNILLAEENPAYGLFCPKTLNGAGVSMHLHVANADAAFAQALAAGATQIMPLADMFWGDRYGVVIDPFGHKWAIASHQRDVSREDIEAAVKAMDH